MTVALSFTALITAVVVAIGTARVGSASTTRVRVQAAADAAALAAVATSVPGRGGDPGVVAARFARLNGATLVHCWCEAGDTAMQVSVVFGGIAATARAVFDPDLLRPSGIAFGLNPRLADAVAVLLRHAQGRVAVTSGWRSPEEQRDLWAKALARHGTPEAADDWVARPGTSAHERGLAVDVAGDIGLARRLIDRFDLPLVAPLAHEPWHFELVGGSS